MITVLSPAKTLDYESRVRTRQFSQPEFLTDSRKLVKRLREMKPEDLSNLMHVSDAIAQLNFSRFLNWQTPFSSENARQAIYAFKGDVYTGLEVESFRAPDLKFAQKHLRILSGLYGILRPLDLMQPYRLEMGTRLTNERGNDLYDFWADKITRRLNQELAKDKRPVLINLASNEYFKAINTPGLKARIVTPVFKDYRSGQFRVLSFFAKKARGRMASWIVHNRVDSPDALENFAEDGYSFNPGLSSEDRPVFTRKET